MFTHTPERQTLARIATLRQSLRAMEFEARKTDPYTRLRLEADMARVKRVLRSLGA